MHALNWTRQEAVDFMTANTPLSDGDIASEVDRYIADPGQALAYKTGELRIQALRNQTQAALGEAFDIRSFHDAVIGTGAVPLDELTHQVRCIPAPLRRECAGLPLRALMASRRRSTS